MGLGRTANVKLLLPEGARPKDGQHWEMARTRRAVRVLGQSLRLAWSPHSLVWLVEHLPEDVVEDATNGAQLVEVRRELKKQTNEQIRRGKRKRRSEKTSWGKTREARTLKLRCD
jgi:hypothetical protein